MPRTPAPPASPPAADAPDRPRTADPSLVAAPSVPALAVAGRGSAADALVVGMTSGARVSVAAAGSLSARTVAALEAAAAAVRFAAGPGDVARVPAVPGQPGEVAVLAGLGPAGPGASAPDALRRAAGAATRSLTGTSGVARVLAVLPARDADGVRAVAEGAALGAYVFTRYRRTPTVPVAAVDVDTATARAAGAGRKALEAAVEAAVTSAAAVALARDLVNTTPLDLYPGSFAAAAREVGAEAGFAVTVLDEDALAEGGYGGILAVGQGSVRPPRLVVLEHAPRGAARHVALVGKGITFDSGGLSLKPPASMPDMKSDMAGAAAVLAAVAAAARTRLPVRVTGYLALAENMPSGTAQRPSDVIVTRGGTTVEVRNTDAEGRLVLADALVDAVAAGPDAVVDVATLTGAATVALGGRISGLMGTDDGLRDRLVAAAAAAGEPTWPMPLPDDLRKQLDSAVADISNVSDSREGGMLLGGLFLRDFVAPRRDDDASRAGGSTRRRAAVPWAHLDVAGPAFNSGSAHDVTPKGGTGVPVRTLLRLLDSYAARS